MDLKGISGSNINVCKIRDDIPIGKYKSALALNKLTEVVVQDGKDKLVIFATDLNVKNKVFGGLPAVGSKVDFGDVKGTVVAVKRGSTGVMNDNLIKANEKEIRDLCVKTPTDLAKDANEELSSKISEAEKKSDSNTNTFSIYGTQVAKEDADEWLKNNPYLSQSPRLVKLADFKTIDGKVDANELSKIASGGAVVLNGPNSFYLPGEKKQESPAQQIQQPTRQPVSAQENYYKRKNAEANAEAAGQVAGLLAGALFGAVNKTLR